MAASFSPSPPKLAYMSSAVRQQRTASRPNTAGTAASHLSRSAEGSRPTTAGRPRQARGRTFLKDNEAPTCLLPQPLPNGISYVATFTSYDDLIDRRILHQRDEQQVHLSTEDVRAMYEQKCSDQGLKMTWEREMRFLELLSAHCRGNTFSLRENGLGVCFARAVAQVLAGNDFYTLVDLSGNRFKDAGAQHIADLLRRNESIVHLSLKSNDMGPDGVSAIAEALTVNCTLTSLDLGGIRGINRNHMGSRGADALGQMLTANHVLCMLDLSSNGLGLEGTGLLAQGLAENGSIVNLNVASNNIGPDGCKVLCAALTTLRVEAIDLSRNDIGDAGAAHLASAMKQSTEGGEHVVTLALDHNLIREAGCRALAPTLRTNASLQVLHLSHNLLGAGAADLAAALRDNRRLRTLTLVQCALGEAEALALAAALQHNSALGHLDISKNRIGDAAGAAIMAALLQNHVLHKLAMSSCGVGNATGRGFANLIARSATLIDVALRQNLIGNDVGAEIREALRGNRVVRTIDLAFNDVAYQAYMGIQQGLDRNNEVWRSGEAPRLEKQIEALDYAQKELFQIEEDIEGERRAIRDRGDELVRRKDTARGQTEMHRRGVSELEDLAAASQEKFDDATGRYRAAEEVMTGDRVKREQRVAQLQHKIELEREKRDRVAKDMERMKKQIKIAADADERAFAPLLELYMSVDADRQSDLADTKWQAESLVGVELQIRGLEHAGGARAEKEAAAAAPAPTSGRRKSSRKSVVS
jgi:Ran GTPase-activating protein (RanGAP) involved in mRNA processing and transport